MAITSIFAIFFLFWVLGCFLVLPFGFEPVSPDDPDFIEGQAESAPRHFRPWRVLGRGTMLAVALCALFYVNYVNGWVTARDLDISRLVLEN